MDWLVDVNPPGPVQANVYGPVPPEGLQVKVWVCPEQIVALDGLTVQVGVALTVIVVLQVLVQPDKVVCRVKVYEPAVEPLLTVTVFPMLDPEMDAPLVLAVIVQSLPDVPPGPVNVSCVP